MEEMHEIAQSYQVSGGDIYMRRCCPTREVTEIHEKILPIQVSGGDI